MKDLRDKIKKLLLLAEKNDNPHEASLARKMAEEIAGRHGIDLTAEEVFYVDTDNAQRVMSASELGSLFMDMLDSIFERYVKVGNDIDLPQDDSDSDLGEEVERLRRQEDRRTFLRVRCTRCGAPVERPCTTPSGRITQCHQARLDRWVMTTSKARVSR